MACIKYIDRGFQEEGYRLIQAANSIIAAYQKEGYKLTLRQLYYQFVARDWLENTGQSYNKLGTLINKGRLAGLIDWEAIEDRTRNLDSLPHWTSPVQIVSQASRQFRLDKWDDQDYRVEVWIEKEALAGVIERICEQLDVPFLACRGYVSQSEMWAAAQRFEEYNSLSQASVILHLGDHDPSGLDMTRDNDERLNSLFGVEVEVHRIALNMSQILELKPPPNYAKITDTRFRDYRNKFGDQSWELDALDPKHLSELIQRHVLAYRDEGRWQAYVEREEHYREQLQKVADDYDWEE